MAFNQNGKQKQKTSKNEKKKLLPLVVVRAIKGHETIAPI